MIEGVTSGGLAYNAGLKKGDRIVMVARQAVKTLSDYLRTVARASKEIEFDVVVLRAGKKMTVKVSLVGDIGDR